MRAKLSAFALIAILGCGSPNATVPGLIKTQGRIASGNKPAAGAILIFHATATVAGQLPPRAKVGLDGAFTVLSADGSDGIPEGDYAVTVVWRSGSGENGEDGRSLVGDKYAHPATTPLKAVVRPGPNGVCVLTAFTLTN